MLSIEDRVELALTLASDFGNIDGEWHKMWTIDQIVRALTGNQAAYETWLAEHKAGKDGPETYDWSEGVAP